MTETSDWFDGYESGWFTPLAGPEVKHYTTGIRTVTRGVLEPPEGTAGEFPEIPGLVSDPDAMTEVTTGFAPATFLAFDIYSDGSASGNANKANLDPYQVRSQFELLTVNLSDAAWASFFAGFEPDGADLGNIPEGWDPEYVTVEYAPGSIALSAARITGHYRPADNGKAVHVAEMSLHYGDGVGIDSGSPQYPGDVWRGWPALTGDEDNDPIDGYPFEIFGTPGPSGALTLIPVDDGSRDEVTRSPIPVEVVVSQEIQMTARILDWNFFVKYQEPQYRFIYDPPPVITAPYARQRQHPSGSAGGWPMRHRHNGGYWGGHPVRQRGA